MDSRKFFKDLFETIPDYRTIVLILFLLKNDVDLPEECGFLRSDNIRLRVECKNIIMEQIEENLDYVKREEESIIEKF